MTVVYGGKMVFPIQDTGHGKPFDEGMCLRDYIAIQAMNGILSNEDSPGMYGLIRRSYEIADAMIEHRVSGEQ